MSYAGDALFPNGASVSNWDNHPLSTGLGSIKLTGGHLISGSTRFASVSGQYDVGRASVKGKGRVVAWGDEAVAYGDVYSTTDGTRFWLNVLRLAHATRRVPGGPPALIAGPGAVGYPGHHGSAGRSGDSWSLLECLTHAAPV